MKAFVATFLITSACGIPLLLFTLLDERHQRRRRRRIADEIAKAIVEGWISAPNMPEGWTPPDAALPHHSAEDFINDRRTDMQTSDIRTRFTFHPATTEERQAAHTEVREACEQLAHGLNLLVPEGREKSTMMTHLEDVMMWANAGIARHGTQSMDSPRTKSA